MATSIARADRLLPDYRTQNGPEKDGIVLATVLVVGLIGFVPAFTLTVRWLAVPLPLPDLVGVGVVLAAYAGSLLVLRRILVGSTVALVVLATFAANLPLLSGATRLPAELGPQLWLFEIPLAGLVAYHLWAGNYSRESFSLTEIAFGGLVLWSLIAAVFGGTRRLDVALFYSLFLFTIWLALTVTIRTVRERIVDYRTLLTAFVVAACGHALFGVVQLVNQSPLGLSHLGETVRMSNRDVLTLGPFGEFYIGVLISGFTGGGAPLSTFLVVATPICLGLAFDARGVWRVPGIVGASLCVVVIRLTAKDAARAAVVITVVCFAVIYLWRERSTVQDSVSTVARRITPVIAVVLGTVVAVLYPSSQSGAGTTVELSEPDSGGAGEGSAAASSSSGGGSGGSTSSADIGGSTVDVSSLSVPYLSLNSLGIRIQQYIAGLDMAIRHPLFGIGGANYPFYAAEYGLPSRQPNGWFPLHNQYLSILAGTGLPGFLAYSVCLVAVLRSGWTATRDQADEWLPVGVLVAFIGFLAVVFWVVSIRYRVMAPLWILGGAIIGRDHLPESEFSE